MTQMCLCEEQGKSWCLLLRCGKLWKELVQAWKICPGGKSLLIIFLFLIPNSSSSSLYLYQLLGFLGSSTGKESVGNAGDSGWIPGSGSSPREGTVYPIHYSWASLVAQTIKNQAVMWETSVRYLSWEDLLEEGMATHSSILAWRIPLTEEPGRLQSMGQQTVRQD